MTCVLMEYILYIQCTVSVLMVSHNWAHVQRKVLGCNYCVLCWASTSWRFVAGFTHNKNRHTHTEGEMMVIKKCIFTDCALLERWSPRGSPSQGASGFGAPKKGKIILVGFQLFFLNKPAVQSSLPCRALFLACPCSAGFNFKMFQAKP